MKPTADLYLYNNQEEKYSLASALQISKTVHSAAELLPQGHITSEILRGGLLQLPSLAIQLENQFETLGLEASTLQNLERPDVEMISRIQNMKACVRGMLLLIKSDNGYLPLNGTPCAFRLNPEYAQNANNFPKYAEALQILYRPLVFRNGSRFADDWHGLPNRVLMHNVKEAIRVRYLKEDVSKKWPKLAEAEKYVNEITHDWEDHDPGVLKIKWGTPKANHVMATDTNLAISLAYTSSHGYVCMPYLTYKTHNRIDAVPVTIEGMPYVLEDFSDPENYTHVTPSEIQQDIKEMFRL